MTALIRWQPPRRRPALFGALLAVGLALAALTLAAGLASII